MKRLNGPAGRSPLLRWITDRSLRPRVRAAVAASNGSAGPPATAYTERLVELGYRLILGRSPSQDERALPVAELGAQRMTPAQFWMDLAASAEFASRIERHITWRSASAVPTFDGDLVEVQAIRDGKPVEEHNAAADNYFASLDRLSSEGLIAKPFSSVHETTELLTCFGHLLAGLRPFPGMTVLDFGAGSCWTSWYFTQLRCDVIACDVSEAALALGRERYRRWPPAGQTVEPRFLVFDGHHIDLPDASVDRICCFDAFHHLANQGEVMAEFARVLKPGGLAGFDEPGHYHSRTAQAQFEMRTYGVIEGDIDLDDIAVMASATDLEFKAVDAFTVQPCWSSLTEFADLLTTGVPNERMQQHLAEQIVNKQLFLLRKRGVEIRDSRDPSALGSELRLMEFAVSRTDDSAQVRLHLRVENTGEGLWLPPSAPVGAVRVGLHLSDSSWEGRVDLDGDNPVAAGEHIEVVAEVAVPTGSGDHELTIGLVSEGVGWFETYGNATIRVRLSQS